MAKVYIVMGVSGCGKTTIGRILAKELSIPFYDADDFHPQANIDKMSSGIPLSDQDRWPWLDLLAIEIQKWKQQEGAVLACSALKEVYRARLFKKSAAFESAKKHFIYLQGNYKLISDRMEQRENHFFDSKLLQSQFDILEIPPYGIRVNSQLGKEQVVHEIRTAFTGEV